MSIRAFLAVDLDERSRRAAARVAEALEGAEGVRFLRPESYHVTLRFLGNLERERVAALASGVAAVLSKAAPFSLRLGGVRLFPGPRRPRALVLDLAPEAPLLDLAELVEAAVVQAGFPPEDRPFRPHLTLGRFLHRGPGALAPVAPADADLPVDRVVLFESRLSRQGARYLPLERMALGGSVSPDHPTSKGEEHGKE
ncbi:MAG: RNA 2',3'-cyclic phosphodiesterase [Myxococcota bacterium]